ncbi:MAG: nucleotidyl transferase AbiEii/AbiGii toxin family protein [Gemmatimonadetes bacterium]|nr:nucleotidyl transferase AbiEii/AbiGii toxin family protein [Gemmatimonadota bacterium]
MIELFREAQALQRFLLERGWPFCFIGGVALQHWGEPRVTRDLDLTVFTGFGGEAPVVDGLLAHYAGRRRDAREFALRHRVLLFSTPAGIAVDLALGALPFEADMIARAAEVEFEPGVALRICSAEDLLVLKAFADRLQDRADVAGIARRRGRGLDWDAVIARLTPLAETKGEPGILETVRGLRAQFGS